MPSSRRGEKGRQGGVQERRRRRVHHRKAAGVVRQRARALSAGSKHRPVSIPVNKLAHLQTAFFLRQLVGFWFMMLGRWKLFELEGGAKAVAEQFFVGGHQDSFLPVWSLRLAGWFDPICEFACGALLILGLGVRYATWPLMFLLVMVTFGHQINEPTYSLSGHVWPPAAGLIAIVWLSGEKDVLSLDHLIRRLLPKKKAQE